jgi:putative phosphoesterase
MKIGILSDTHNNFENLQTALNLFQQEGISRLFHCGDLTGAEIARKLAGFEVTCVLGNVDVASGEIRETLLAQNPENSVGLVYRGQVGDARIAATHGHIPGALDELVHAGSFDYVFTGHSHLHKEERFGITRLINPGSLGGLRREERHVCLLDLDSGKARFIEIK